MCRKPRHNGGAEKSLRRGRKKYSGYVRHTCAQPVIRAMTEAETQSVPSEDIYYIIHRPVKGFNYKKGVPEGTPLN